MNKITSAFKGLIAQVVNTSGIYEQVVWYDFRLSVTPHQRARTYTHKGVHTHTTKWSALAWSLYIISHTTPLHLADSENAYRPYAIPNVKQIVNLFPDTTTPF